MSRPSAATNSLPPPRSTPSVSQISSTSGVAARKRPSVGSMSARSTACGFGLICLSRTRAAAGVSNEMSRLGSDSGISATPRLSASARAIRSSAVRMRASQVPAAGKPSSISSASGALAVEVATGGFHSGPAAAMMTSAASVSRSSVSHHGVRCGCLLLRRDVEQQPGRREIDAARLRRNEPQQPPQHRQAQAARAAPAAARSRAASTRPIHGVDLPAAGPEMRLRCHGVPAASHADGAGRRRAHARVQRQQQLGRRPVGAVDGEAPAELVGLGADLGAVARDARLVVGLPGLGAAGRDRAGAFRLDELDAAGIGKGLFRRIDDLHGVAMRAGRRELRERLAHLRHRAPEIRHHHDLGERRRRERRRQARPLGHVMHDRVRHLVEHVAAAGRPHQARHADALAGLHQHLGEREGDHQASDRAWTPARAASVNTIEGERSGHSHTVCAASHSCSRT